MHQGMENYFLFSDMNDECEHYEIMEICHECVDCDIIFSVY